MTRSSRRLVGTASWSSARRISGPRSSAPSARGSRRWSTCSPTRPSFTRASPTSPEPAQLACGWRPSRGALVGQSSHGWRAVRRSRRAQGAADEDVVLGDLHLVELERAEGLGEEDHAGDDRRERGRGRGRRPTALGFVHVREAREQHLDGGEQERVAMDAHGVVWIELLVDRSGRGGRAGDGDPTRDGRALLGRQPGEEDASVPPARAAAARPERVDRCGCGARSSARPQRAATRGTRRSSRGRR